MDIQQLWEPETRANLAAVQPSRPEHHSLVSGNQNSESQEHQGPGYHMSTCQGITGNPSGSTCTDHVMNASDEKPVHGDHRNWYRIFFDTIIRLSILASVLHYNERIPELEMDVLFHQFLPSGCCPL